MASGKWTGYAWAVTATTACTAAGFAMQGRFDAVNIAMVYLLAVVVVALRLDRGPAIATASLSVLAFDVLFVPPAGSLKIDDIQYLLTFAILIAVALVISSLKERVRSEAQAQARLALDAETERIRSTLLASISHDLRTPLAVLTGASSSLADDGERLSPEERNALARSVFEQSRALADQVAKILDMTRLETGALKVDRDWASLEEIAATALGKVARRLADHRVMVEMPRDLPLVRVDALLIEQALSNLLENAGRHTPLGTVVRLIGVVKGNELIVTVEDYGGGLPDGDVERLFDKFSGVGMGLGLAIVRAVARVHGGRAWAERVPEGGTAFRLALPLEPQPMPPTE